MEIEYTIEPEHNLVRMKIRGEVTTDEFIRNARILYSDPMFKKGMNTLVDSSEAEYKHSFGEALMIHDFVAAIEPARGTCRWALCDAGKSGARSFFELYTTISDDLEIETRAFDNADEAEKWVMEKRDGNGDFF